ncbi:MAG: TVP38/TMEM64 family protein, partial [Candidatus Rokuibacteriota bacterium]
MRRSPALLIIVPCLVGVVLLSIAPGIRHGLGHALHLIYLEGELAALRDYLRGFGVWAPLVSGALMQLQAVIAPLPAFPLMYANGLLFGTLWGGLLSWVSILVSAVLCFGLARLFGRPLVERLVSEAALAWADRAFA